MNPQDLLRIVDSLHRDKNIDTEIVFQAIEAAYLSAARKQYGEEADIVVRINRTDGVMEAICDEKALDPEEIGRIGAQTAKQVIIQKIREAERDALIEEYQDQLGHLIAGVVQRNEGGATTVSLGGLEAILPRSEQIPGESHHANERIRAIIYEVKPQGNRVKVVLSRTNPKLVRRLFEQEIPEIADGVISINAMSREPGYRSKVAVSSTDQRIDCVGACVGVRGNRIKNIVDELAGERIDIVRWSDDPELLIPNALQPADVEQVLLCDMIGRAIVLVKEDQLSLAIGRRGQNVRLASKLCGWDIEIMTGDELDEQIERAVMGFGELDGMTDELSQGLVEQGYLSYDDLSVIEPDALKDMGELSDEIVNQIIDQAEKKAEEAEIAAAEQRRRQREQERMASAAKIEAAAKAAEEGAAEENAPESESEPAAEAAVTASAEVVTDESAEPVAEASAEVATDESAEPVAEASAEVVTDESAEPVAEASAEVVTDESAEPVAEAPADEEMPSETESAESQDDSEVETPSESLEMEKPETE